MKQLARPLGIVLLLVIQLALVLTAPALAEVVASLKFKTLYLDTVIVDQGKPNALIVVADETLYQNLARQCQKAISDAAGVKLPIKSASSLADKFGRLIGEPPAQNLILIAGPHTNNMVTHLIRSSYCALETDYPGKGGSIVKTIHDPWGHGANAILLAGSDIQGVEQAVQRFLAKLPKTNSITIPRTIDIVLPTPATEPTDAEIKAELVKQRTNFEQGQQGGLFTPICHAGHSYARTGKEGYVKLYRDLLFLEYECRKNIGSAWDSPWGPAADFLFSQVIDTWDSLEESPTLSDSDRQQMLDIILEYSRYNSTYWGTNGIDKPVLRNNHNTFTCIGLLKAGVHFDKYYKLPEAREWINKGEMCFAPLMKSFKSQEDCSGYGWITMRHVCNYALTRPDYSWFTSGLGDLAGDLFIMTTDNLGNQATFGDVGGWQGNGQVALWTNLVDVERKGRYAWAIRKVRGSSEPGTAVHGVEPVEPADLLGLQRRVTEPMFFSLYGAKSTVPHERTFDKITMRTSFDPQKPYLLLDGINGGYHGHQDANSILRLTDKGRIWLADCDYIKSLPRYHNSMLILRDGQSGRMPAFAECELAADLASIRFTSTTIRDYAGTDWRRNILWDKNRGFVFMDEIVAKETNDFSARCIWHTLGAPKLEGSAFQVTQKGRTFSIQNLDGASMRHSDDAEMGKNWAGYEYADPVIRTLQQVRSRKLAAGERICFMNVLSIGSVKADRAGESSALIGTGKERALVGVRSGEGDILPGLRTDARVYWVSNGRIALGSLTSLRLNGTTVISSQSPISIELGSGGECVIVAESAVKMRLAANPVMLKLDGKRLSSSPDNGMALVEIPAGRHVLSGLNVPDISFDLPEPSPADRQAQALPAGTKRLVEAASPHVGEKILSLAADESGVYVGRADGKLSALAGDKEWVFDAGEPITALHVGKLAKSDPDRVAAGTSKGRIILLDRAGAKLWERQLPFYKVDPLVDYFTTADLSGDGNRALVLGSENWQHFAYDASGQQLWSFMSIRGSTAGAAADINGDGKEEPLVGTEYNCVYALNADGTQKWRVTRIGGPRINAVVSSVLSQTGKPGMVFGGAEGTAYAYDADGKLVWSHSTGDEITCIQNLDIDGDGLAEMIIGSRSFSLTAVGRDGKRIWRTDIGEPILSMALADLTGDGRPEICVGTEDGQVVALDQKGKVLASWSTAGPVKRMAAVPGSPARLAVACEDGRLVLLKM